MQDHASNSAIDISGRKPLGFQFAPSAGFAYDIDGRGGTVVRGGFGTNYYVDPGINAYSAVGAPPNLKIFSFYASSGTPLTLSNVSSINPATNPGVVYGSADPNDHATPVTYSWNLAVSHVFPGAIHFETSYVGNTTRHLNGYYATNLVPLGSETIAHDGGPYYGTYYQQLYRPYKSFGDIGYNTHNLGSNYHSLQVTASRSKGWANAWLTYTYGKALGDTCEDAFNHSNTRCRPHRWQGWISLRQQLCAAVADARPHRLPGRSQAAGQHNFPARSSDGHTCQQLLLMAIQSLVGQRSTAVRHGQLITQIETDSGKVFAFFAIPGVEPEFCFDAASVSNVAIPGSVILHSGGSTLIRKLVPGMKTTIQFTDASGTHITLLLLTQEQAENLAQLRVSGAERLVVSSSATFFDGHALHLQATSPTQHYAMLAADGSGWESYTLTQPEKHFAVAVTQTSIGKRTAQMTMGPYVDWRKSAVPVVPPDSAFDSAATWQIEWKNPDLAGLSEALLQIDYSGDIGRLKAGTTLLDDNFFHGVPWQVGLKRFLPDLSENPKAAFTLQILGLPPRAPIYLDKKARALAATAAPVRIKLLPVYESTTTIH